jgi:hypothetical protein
VRFTWTCGTDGKWYQDAAVKGNSLVARARWIFGLSASSPGNWGRSKTRRHVKSTMVAALRAAGAFSRRSPNRQGRRTDLLAVPDKASRVLAMPRQLTSSSAGMSNCRQNGGAAKSSFFSEGRSGVLN